MDFNTILENTQQNLSNQANVDAALAAIQKIRSEASVGSSEPQFNKEVMTTYNGNTQELLDVEKLNLHSTEHGDIESAKGIFCDGKYIQTVSNSYEVHQPKEIAEQFRRVSDTHELTVRKCLFNKENGGLLISATYANTRIAGERHDVNVTFYTSHCGRYKTVLSLSALRIACMNQVPMIVKGTSNHLFSEKHYKNSLNMEAFGGLLAKIPALVAAHNERAMALREGTLSFTDFVDLCIEQWNIEKSSKQCDKRVQKLRDAYYSGDGQQILENNTGYKAYNAITYLNTHDLRESMYKEENIITTKAKDSLVFEQILLDACA